MGSGIDKYSSSIRLNNVAKKLLAIIQLCRVLYELVVRIRTLARRKTLRLLTAAMYPF